MSASGSSSAVPDLGGGLAEDAEDEEEFHTDSDCEETLDEKPKSLIFNILKQLRPNMDLSRITFPTFVLEPRSLLEKLTDFLSHPMLLIDAGDVEDPLERFVEVVRWYLSGWHVRPKGPKKPYNPILGEMFECEYSLEDGCRLKFLAEQVSHHPPVAAFHASCRRRNMLMNGYYHPRSRFYGNSAGTIGEGLCHLYFLHRNERYEMTWPNVVVKGIFLGKLRMEMAGNVYVKCEETGYMAELEFKNKGFFGGQPNSIQGKIKEIRGKQKKLFRISGRWDRELQIHPEGKKKEKKTFFNPDEHKKWRKLVRRADKQEPNESRRVWADLTSAIKSRDQKLAGECKHKVEEEQRALRRDREEKGEEWEQKYFHKVGEDYWVYNDINLSPYDPAEEEEAVSGAEGGSSS